MLRSLVTLAALIAGLTAFPAAASALSCAYDATQHRLTVIPTAYDDSQDLPGVVREGEQIRVVNRDGVQVACTGGEPTVFNTDTIAYTDNQREHTRFSVSLEGGPLAPGFTDEGDGSSEIEVLLTMGTGIDSVALLGSSGPDRFEIGGAAGGEVRANLNAGEPVGDADVVAGGVDSSVSVSTAAAPDTVDARGGAVTGAPLGVFASIASGDGDDTLHAGPGGSGLFSGAGDDVLAGAEGDDFMIPGAGDDDMTGGDGFDFVTFTRSLPGIAVDLSDNEPQQTGEGLDTLSGMDGVHGTDGPDRIYGTDEPNSLFAHGGPDHLRGGGGDDSLGGGTERDVVDYSTAPGGIDARLSRYGGVVFGAAGTDRLFEVEDVIGSAHADEMLGSPQNNRLYGRAGADKLMGLGGHDLIDPGTSRLGGPDGADTVEGGDGIDTISYAGRAEPVAVRLDGSRNEGHDPDGNGISRSDEEGDSASGVEHAIGGDGPDRLKAVGAAVNHLTGGPGDDRLDGGDGADTLDGGEGVDVISYAGRTGPVAVRLDAYRNEGADPNGDGLSSAQEEGDYAKDIEVAHGGDGPDRLKAVGPVANRLVGGPGDDRLDGGEGSDVLDGRAGADTMIYAGRPGRVAVTLDTIRNDGTDLDGDGVSVRAEEGDLDMSIENVVGGHGNDRLRVANYGVVNVLTGGPGADFLDTVDGSSTPDRLNCGTGSDEYRSDPPDVERDCETASP